MPATGTAPLWWEGATPAPPEPPRLPASADVVIVGGGFTGLWTAHHLLAADPGRQVLVLEAQHVGFGASGRNGGWVCAQWPVTLDRVAGAHGRPAADSLLAALRESIDDIGAFCAAHAPEAGFVRGGTLLAARNPAQATRAKRYAAHAAAWGSGTRWLDRDEFNERVAVAGALGGTFDPDCARIHPRALVDALARRVRASGALVAERCPVADVATGTVTLADGRRITADRIVLATEAWTARLPGRRRALAPVYSLMVATEPLTSEQWAEIGLARRETFGDHGHVVIYGQRTTDDRIAFGGRGAPYHVGSRIRPSFDHDARVAEGLRTTLRTLFPSLGRARFTHAWGGPLGIARDWHPSVRYDPMTRIGWAGGYVGDGVAASQLAGRTLADLLLDRDTARTGLPFVHHRSPAWEPEPLRWLGVNAGLTLASVADAQERRTGRPARAAYLLDRLTGG